MKYLVIFLLIIGLSLSMNLAYAIQPEYGKDVATYLFDYENKPKNHPCYFDHPPKYSQGQLIPDIGYPPENFEERMGKFLLEHTVTSNSNEIHLKIALLDNQNKTIPHVGFFLNVTKQDETSFTKLFHTHSGTLDIMLNQNHSASEWSSEGRLEPYQGGLESDNDHFIVDIPILAQGIYHFDVTGFSAYDDTSLFSYSCAPKFDWSLVIDEYGNAEIVTDSKSNHSYSRIYVSPLKQFSIGIHPEDIKCKESLTLVTKYDGSPACVKPETKIKLIERGWAQGSESKQPSLYSNKFPNIEDRNIQVNVGELRISQTGLSVMVLEKTSRTEPSRSIMFQKVTPSYSGSFNSDDVLYEFFKVSSEEGEENITETYYDTPISNTVIAGNDKEYFSIYFPIEIPLKSSVQNSIIQFNYSLPYITPDFDQKYSFGLVSLSPLTINLPNDSKLIGNETSTYSSFWFFDKSGGELSHKTDGYMLYYGALNPPIKIQNLIVYNVEFELDAKK